MGLPGLEYPGFDQIWGVALRAVRETGIVMMRKVAPGPSCGFSLFVWTCLPVVFIYLFILTTEGSD